MANWSGIVKQLKKERDLESDNYQDSMRHSPDVQSETSPAVSRGSRVSGVIECL